MTTVDPIADALQIRRSVQRRRSRNALALSFAIAIVWLVFVVVNGHLGRVGDRWVAALTMIFGSIVAGSTPQGGGAVAFPVFTKVLDVPTTVARTFSLCIQTVGMGAAALAIVTSGRQVDWRSLRRIAPAAVVAFLASAWLIGKPDEVFWPSTLPGPYVKVTFTIVVAAMAVLVWIESRDDVTVRNDQLSDISGRSTALLCLCGVLGGVASFLVGSGADVFTYLGLVALLGLAGGVGVPTSVVVMAIVSCCGFLLFGVFDEQLAVQLNDTGQVTAVGGHEFESARDPQKFDVYGMWLAAVPVVGFGAPLGSWIASKMSDVSLARLVVGLAVAETISTIIFLDDLRSDGVLAVFGGVGLVLVVTLMILLKRHRHRLLAIPPIDTAQTITPRKASLRSKQQTKEPTP